MKRTGETTAVASIAVGILAAITRLGLSGALVMGLIVGVTVALLSLRAASQRVGAA